MTTTRRRERAGDNLHLGKEVAEVLGMPAFPSATLHEAVVRYRECRRVQNARDLLAPRRAQRLAIHRNSSRHEPSFQIVRFEQLAREPPELVDRGLHPLMALHYPVAELQDPVAAVSGVVSRLLVRFRGDSGEISVLRRLQALEMQNLEDRDQELARHREREISARKLHDQCVPELDGFAEVGQRVGGPPLPFDLASQLQQKVRLADEVERDVGQRDVLLEDRPMAAPFRETMAEDEAIVAEAEEIVGEGHQLRC
jgi:hypothetical protein